MHAFFSMNLDALKLHFAEFAFFILCNEFSLQGDCDYSAARAVVAMAESRFGPSPASWRKLDCDFQLAKAGSTATNDDGLSSKSL